MADADEPVCFRCDAAVEDVLMRAALVPEHRTVYAANPSTGHATSSPAAGYGPALRSAPAGRTA